MDGLFADPRVDALVEVLQVTPGWPSDGPKDDTFARKMLLEYPHLDLCAEVERWQAWISLHPEKVDPRKANMRSRFVTWCKQGTRFGVQRREQGRAKDRRGPRRSAVQDRGGSRTSTRAGRPDEHGESGRLEHW